MGMVSAINDLAFKKALGSVENLDILGGFITDFFGIIPTEIVIENPYSIDVFKKSIQGEEVSELRETAKDISALIKISSGTANFIAELQVKKKIFYSERSVYYAFDRFCQNYNAEGQMQLDSEKKPIRYSSLKPVYALNILGYNSFTEDTDALRIFELYDVKNKRYPKRELIKIGYFELHKETINTPNQGYWQDYFLGREIADKAPAYIKKARSAIDYINLAEEERKMVDSLMKFEDDRQDEIYTGFLEGKLEGKLEGELEGKLKGKLEDARNMLADGISMEKISRWIGIPIDKIKKDIGTY
ncbi:hypothetical protein FACS1894200_10820 [Spirochaetia bacterium]|nr:hypothetical protein FACS1894200_10820 [Spirochaetia bacterium]